MLQPNNELHNGHGHSAVTHGHAPDRQRLPPSGLNLKDYVEQVELDLIRQALERSRGVVASAARLLCLRRTTLVEKMRKYRNLNQRFTTAA